jgi:hypothetical protein
MVRVHLDMQRVNQDDEKRKLTHACVAPYLLMNISSHENCDTHILQSSKQVMKLGRRYREATNRRSTLDEVELNNIVK